MKKGVSDFLAINELDAISKARQIIAHLNYRKLSRLPSLHLSSSFVEPFYDPRSFFLIFILFYVILFYFIYYF